MHPPIENIEVPDEADETRLATRKRVDDANLDTVVRRQRKQPGVDVFGQRVVHEQTDANTTFRRLDQAHRDQVAA